MPDVLPSDFYREPDVVAVARSLLGKRLMSTCGGALTGGVIVETEAYAGTTDRASHAFGGRRTARTETMYAGGGVAYVYLCYGMHALFNVVTNGPGIPHAVLVRALEPVEGIDTMLKRRGMVREERRLTAGPGVLTAALGIGVCVDGVELTGNRVWIEDAPEVSAADIVASPRVGVHYAGEDASRPWRFRIQGNGWTSPAK